MVFAETAHALFTEAVGQYPAHFTQELISFLKTVLTVIVLHAYEVKEQHDRRAAAVGKTLALCLGQLEEIPHIRQTRQHVCVDPPVQICDIVLDLIAHPDKGLGELADLVLAPVIQRHIIIFVGKPL